MMTLRPTIVLASLVALMTLACNKNKEPESPDAVDNDGPMEDAGEWTDEAAEDVGETTEETADDVGDEFDGDPNTD